MDKTDDDLLELVTTLRYKKIKEDLLVGQCLEYPFIIVKGKTIKNLFEQIGEHLAIYFTTFPDKAEREFQKRKEEPVVVNKEREKISQSEWELHKQLITIPAR